MRESEMSPEADADNAVGAAHYIAALTDELARIAKRHGLNSLGCLLDMARLEADQVVKKAPRPGRA